jgi:hypothetical protein
MISLDYADIVRVYIYSFFLALSFKLGTAPFVNLLVNLISPSSKDFQTSWSSLQEKRHQLGTISAQEEFAKWARLQREIETEQKAFDQKFAERRERLFWLNSVLSVGLKALVVLGWGIVLNWIRLVKFRISKEILGFTPINAPLLFFLCFLSFYRILGLKKI